MADTIITNTPERRVEDNGAAGLLLAFIVIVALLIGGYFLYRHGAPGVPNTGSTNVNVTLPSSGGSAGGSSSGGSLQGSVSGSGSASGAATQ